VKWWDRFSENTINSTTSPPANITTAISLASHIPASRVSEVLFGGVGTTNSQLVGVSGISGTCQAMFFGATTNTGSGDLYEWENNSSSNHFIPIVDGSVYWGDGTLSNNAGTIQLAIHAVKIKR
jgi:plastocyanin